MKTMATRAPIRTTLTRFVLLLAVLWLAIVPSPARAEPPANQGPPPQGIAVIGLANARDEAFTLARAIYKSSLRPPMLDEIRARVLAGDAPPPNASREVRDLGELRAGVKGDDAASRQLLASIATRTRVRAILVVSIAEVDETTPASDAGATDPDAGTTVRAARPRARLYLADTNDLDAARYAPDDGMVGMEAWQSTVLSLERRFPPPPGGAAGPHPAVATSPASLRVPEEKDSKPFYKSPWFWGGIGAAVLLGGFFYFASRDTSDDPIHLEMRVPR
jgi:hypothetical protein